MLFGKDTGRFKVNWDFIFSFLGFQKMKLSKLGKIKRQQKLSNKFKILGFMGLTAEPRTITKQQTAET